MFDKEHYMKCLHPNEKDNEFWKSDETYTAFQENYDICKEFNPQSIVEIGVRYGYSAYAYLSACPTAHYYGFDLTTGNRRSGGVRSTDTLPYVKETLKKHFPKSQVKLFYKNSQLCTLLKEFDEPIDFFHVDGNHSVNGCFHDLVVALYTVKEGGIILVDDITNHLVKQGTKLFCDIFQYNLKDVDFRDTKKGDCIITTGNTPYEGATC